MNDEDGFPPRGGFETIGSGPPIASDGDAVPPPNRLGHLL